MTRTRCVGGHPLARPAPRSAPSQFADMHYNNGADTTCLNVPPLMKCSDLVSNPCHGPCRCVSRVSPEKSKGSGGCSTCLSVVLKGLLQQRRAPSTPNARLPLKQKLCASLPREGQWHVPVKPCMSFVWSNWLFFVAAILMFRIQCKSNDNLRSNRPSPVASTLPPFPCRPRTEHHRFSSAAAARREARFRGEAGPRNILASYSYVVHIGQPVSPSLAWADVAPSPSLSHSRSLPFAPYVASLSPSLLLHPSRSGLPGLHWRQH